MNVGLKYRAELSQVAYLVDELDQIIATIRGSWGVQHKDDDTHGAITADSITTTGNAAFGGNGTFVGYLKAFLGDTVRESGIISSSSLVGDPSNVGLLLGGTTNGFFIEQRQSTSPFDGSTWELAAWNLKQSTAKPSLRLGILGGTPTILDGGTGSSLALGDANRSIAGIYLNGFNVGTWTSVTYSSSNFTGSGSMTWGVGSADQTTYAYTLLNKTLTVSFNIGNSDVTAPVGISLQIKIPGGYTAAKQMSAPILVTDAGGAQAVGYAIVTASGTNILCRKIDNSNWTATAGNNTNVSGQITIEIQ